MCNDKNKSENKTLWLFITWGDIEPEIMGPFESEDARDAKARELKDEHGDENGIFPLDLVNGIPDVWAYSGGFFLDPLNFSDRK